MRLLSVDWLMARLPRDLLAEYERQRAPLWAEYERQRAPLLAEYERQEAPLWAEYERQEAPLWAEYERQHAPLIVAALRAWIQRGLDGPAAQEDER